MSDATSPRTARLSVPGREPVELPILESTMGPGVIDVRGLYSATGLFTYDPGYTSTASCQSKITFIDGEKGILLHRGYRIEDLAEKCSYLEVCYLLLHGELPTRAQLDEFVHHITYHTMVHEQISYLFRGFRRDSHPMAVMIGVVGALSAFYYEDLDVDDPHQRMIVTHRLIAKVPTIAAMAYKYSVGQPFMYPRNDLDYASNFLHMMFAVPCEPYKVNPVMARALDKILILHADHEQNASTSTVRLVGSTGASPYAAIAAGIAALWGPAHGGANEAVLNMLKQIGSVSNIKSFLEKVKDKDSNTRLMGFGHRVYKNYDPRAAVLKKSADEVLAELGKKHNPLLEIAKELEKIALEDEYFVKRKLFPNVDFYSGIILEALGIPTRMFTAIFAMARTVGWIAQWNEMIEDPQQKIGRPRQLYVGERERPSCRSRRAGKRKAQEPSAGRASRHDLGAEAAFRRDLVPNPRKAAELPDPEALTEELDLEREGVAGAHRAAKARLFDGGEVDRGALGARPQARHRENRRRLGEGLDHEHSRHDRVVGKMAGKEGFIKGHVLDPHRALEGLDLGEAIDEQHGVAVRERAHDPEIVDIGQSRAHRNGLIAHGRRPPFRLFAIGTKGKRALIRCSRSLGPLPSATCDRAAPAPRP